MAKQDTKYGWNFDNTYSQLPEVFFAKVNPTPGPAPKMAIFNEVLAQSLGLNSEALNNSDGAALLAGNVIPEGAEPIAQAYAGHQFGHFTMLGDGRAHLLGEHVTPKGDRLDIQLKGSGPTPFSRRGDGRAAYGPMLREYIISEAMHALGIPTTRSLAVIKTGEPVYRETQLPGAVLSRVASSHIRVGTFEYGAVINQPENFRALVDYTIKRHYPHLLESQEPYLAFLNAVIDKQASLVCQWMLVGFIHGVMNTDNMSLAGETIDYGPCAFMDRYSHATVFSSIDSGGRYAYRNQPPIAQWNVTRLAETLLPLIDEQEDQAIAKAQDALDSFRTKYEENWLGGMRAKLGLTNEESEDRDFAESLLTLMEKHQSDYTNTFRALSVGLKPDQPLSEDAEFLNWHKRWLSRQPSFDLMRSRNPVVIARNHRVEEALSAAVEQDDLSVLKALVATLQNPFDESAESKYRQPPLAGGEGYQTFCGT